MFLDFNPHKKLVVNEGDSNPTVLLNYRMSLFVDHMINCWTLSHYYCELV